MPRYGVKTSLSPEDVIEAAERYFGADGLEMDREETGACCAYFQGGGGFVRVTAGEEGGQTTVDLETREWDYHVRQFMEEIG